MKKAYDIPGINNHRCVLALFLGIDDESAALESRVTSGNVHEYVYEGQTYYVAHASVGLASGSSYAFNSSQYSILKEDPEQPYVRFRDDLVLKQLSANAPEGKLVKAVVQKSHYALMVDSECQYSVWSYAAHLPNDLSTYYWRGVYSDDFNTVKQIFGDHCSLSKAVELT